MPFLSSSSCPARAAASFFPPFPTLIPKSCVFPAFFPCWKHGLGCVCVCGVISRLSFCVSDSYKQKHSLKPPDRGSHSLSAFILPALPFPKYSPQKTGISPPLNLTGKGREGPSRSQRPPPTCCSSPDPFPAGKSGRACRHERENKDESLSCCGAGRENMEYPQQPSQIPAPGMRRGL